MRPKSSLFGGCDQRARKRPTPRVTVIIPTYNWATVLPYSIGSVLDQTFVDFELLVIGDGCTDESARVVESIGDPRVRWHNLPSNTGQQPGPNNEGLRRARGDVIAYLGHDDLWLPQHLEALLNAINGGSRIVHGTRLDVRPDQRPEIWPPTEGWQYQPGEWIAPTCVMHDRALVEEIGGWRMARDTGDYDPEAELWQRMAAVSHVPKWVPRLTSVKLAAAYRHNVYRDRPSHEQAYWLRRIREGDNPEQSLLAACGESYVFAHEGTHSGWPSRTKRLVRALHTRLGISQRLQGSEILPPDPTNAEERRRVRRIFKGIQD